ncbi:MAG: LptF/LptG family permease [Mesorhizobium sp.]|nr:MAG: LptF/LptG family permease [Mesorhizobium sp.]
MGWTLGRYFFFRYVSITIWFFLGLLALVFLIDFTELSGRTTGLPGFTYGTAFAISALRMPMIMLQTVPFVGLFSVGVLNPIAAHGFSWSEQMENQLRAGKSNSVAEDTTPWLRQKTNSGDTIIGARAILNQGLEMADAVFFVLDQQGNIVERKDAARAFLRDGYWELQDVKLFKDGNIRAETSDRVATNLKPEFVQERLARPETIPFYDLPAKIEVARSFGLKANAFAMQFDSLVALPFLLVAMTLIAATVSMRFARMGQSATMILGGVLAGFLLYVVSVLVKAFGVAGFVPTMVAAWVPVVVAMFFGVTFLLYKEDG